jgi:arginase
LAVKIVRQPKKIALIGAASSAAAFAPGTEKAPAALRAAGLVERLKSAGYEVVDYGDCPPRLFADDDEHRRARNLPAIVAGLNDLKVHAEVAIKSGAFVLVLGGDCAQSIGLLTGARRYYKHLNLLWFDRDADLNTPATTPSGRIDGMVVAHIIGRGAPELVRFWSDAALVREPDVTLFGIERLDSPEQEFLNKSPLRHVLASAIRSKGATAAAKAALTHVHADTREFILHLDLDVIDQEDLPAVNVPGSGGLRFDEVRSALTEFLSHKNLLGLDVAQFNPDKDPDGAAARKIVDLLVECLTARLHTESALSTDPAIATTAPEAAALSPVFESPVSKVPASEPPPSVPEAVTEPTVEERHPKHPAAAELSAPDSAEAASDAPEPVSVDPSVADPEGFAEATQPESHAIDPLATGSAATQPGRAAASHRATSASEIEDAPAPENARGATPSES